MQLVIANKNYSSWSMRPWVLMRQLELHFEEVFVPFDDMGEHSAFKRAVAHHSPSGRVPVLIDDGFAVWDSLAICEYLHDKFPGRGVWPEDMQDRARARSLAAEMHSGFSAMRNLCPMNIEAHMPEIGARLWAENPGLRSDMQRLELMWAEALVASGGPFLFGPFGAVDAMYAPVCMRLRTFELPMAGTTNDYVAAISETAAVRAWVADALAEHRFVPMDEPYRSHR